MREDTVNVTMRVNEKLLENLLAIDSVEKLIALQDEEVNGYIQVSGYAHCSTGMFNVMMMQRKKHCLLKIGTTMVK